MRHLHVRWMECVSFAACEVVLEEERTGLHLEIHILLKYDFTCQSADESQANLHDLQAKSTKPRGM